jgi:uncharacterized protein (TIGR03086 family)
VDTIDALSQTFDQMHQIVKGVSADQLTNATPCREWDVRALLDHTLSVVGGLGAAAAGREPSPFGLDEGDIAGQFRALAGASLAAWRAPGVLDREMDAGAGPMPGATYASINTLDTLVHAWDLARATGQDDALPDALAEHVLGFCQAVVTPEARQVAGFDPAIDPPVGAGATERLVAFLGRQP